METQTQIGHETDANPTQLPPLARFVRLGHRKGAIMQYPTQRDALDFLADDQNADTLRLAIEQLEDQLAEVLDLNEDEIGTGDFSVEALRALAEEIELLERESPLV